MTVSWIVQSNLGTDKIHLTIKDACHKLGLPCSFVKRIPFSKELPDVPTNVPTIFYGSTRFVNTVFASKKWSPAAFFDPDTFLATVWGPAYGEYWLNQGAKFTTLGEFIWEPNLPDRLFFVRPVRDLKEFNGGIWSFGQLRRWNSGLLKTDLGSEQLSDIPILVSDPWGISREWRLFMVDGKVSSASQYKLKDTLSLDANVPQEVLTFGEQMAEIFSPHKIFILDICESAGHLYVLEVGCINSAGFYAANVKKIVEDVSSQV